MSTNNDFPSLLPTLPRRNLPPRPPPLLPPPPPPSDGVRITQQQQQQQQAWREREHRQRTIRLLMMFLMMLLLMDEDGNNNSDSQQRDREHRLRGSNNNGNDDAYNYDDSASPVRSSSSSTDSRVSKSNSQLGDNDDDGNDEKKKKRRRRLFLQHRQRQDFMLQNSTRYHERYQYLLQRQHQSSPNKQQLVDYNRYIHIWCQNQMEMVKDEFFPISTTTKTTVSSLLPVSTIDADDEYDKHVISYDTTTTIDPTAPRNNNNNSSNRRMTTGGSLDTTPMDDARMVYHYPWNTTGFYRGSWQRLPSPLFISSSSDRIFDENYDHVALYILSLMNTNKRVSRIDWNGIAKRNTARGSNDTATTTTTQSSSLTDAIVSAVQIQEIMLERLQLRNQVAAIVPIPDGFQLLLSSRDRYHSGDNKNNSSGRNSHNNDKGATATSEAIRDVGRASDGGFTSTAVDSNDDNQEQQQQQQQQYRRIAGMNEYSTKDIISQTISSIQRQIWQQRQQQQFRDYVVEGPKVTLTRDDGRAAFQLFGKRIIGMKELSYVSGFVKLYDSMATGYSTRKDVLLRVQGVLLHSIGRLSLVANINEDAMAFVIDPSYHPDNANEAYHRLRKAVESLLASSSSIYNNSESLEEEAILLVNIRKEAIALYGKDVDTSDDGMWNVVTVDRSEEKEDEAGSTNPDSTAAAAKNIPTINETEATLENNTIRRMSELNNGATTDTWSDFVIPYPFVHDDVDGSVHTSRTVLSSKTMPLREQALEANAAGCSFEISMDVSEVEFSIGSWKKMLLRRYREMKMMDPSNQPDDGTLHDSGAKHSNNNGGHRHVRPYASSRSSYRPSREYPHEALVMNMVGEIHSYTCNFHAQVNVTALRTDWDATTSKAINYSFYMMLVCLTQIFILLRQLLHSQSQSIAIRVSIICIGWQTVIDALLCLTHVYLSLAVQPLFTAFASVAFFKLLIFCVIEMKYIAIILQARNNSNGGPSLTATALRQQVAVLHIRFYVALVAVFLLVFYSPGRYRTYNMLALYSFWVPQIILNVITEAKAPLHKNYIYGMSLTRLIAPLYIFGLRNNFLKEVYPESTTDPLMCQLLILWVGCQTAILIAQGKYGARFMIPKRFLPPKFDYNRTIPTSMLPPGALLDLPAPELMEDRANDGLQPNGSTKREDEDLLNTTTISSNSRESDLRSVTLRHQTADTTRSRHHRGGGRGTSGTNNQHSHRSRNTGSAMVKEDVTVLPKAKPTPAPVLECSICYDNIDIRDRFNYMLAPCNHLYHSECLKQWMEVKLECPICRTPLPPL